MTTSVYVDSNILITLFEGFGPSCDDLWQFLNACVASERVAFHTSALTFAELLVKPYRDGDAILARQYLTLARSDHAWMTIHEVSPTVVEIAAALRARMRLKLPDAIHLATATRHACQYLLTFDAGIPDLPEFDHPLSGKVLGPPVAVVHPDPVSLAELSEAILQ